MWPPPQSRLNYGLTPEMGMLGLRDVFVVAPASSFHHTHHDSSAAVDPHSLSASNATALGVGVGLGVIPVLTAGPYPDDGDELGNRARGGGIQLSWQQQTQQQQQQQQQAQHYLKAKPASAAGGVYDYGNLVQSSSGGGGGGSAATCQDCGNQAKKDCSHRRCRTCCKSRGFDCATHVKSTWVPAARRRERQLGAAPVGPPGSSASTSGLKKPRLITSQTTTTSHTSTSNTTPPRSFDTSSSHQDASFKDGLPGQVRAPAVFKCVRVTAMDDGEDQFAYQAVVKIQGHVFKGFLYDQGTETARDHVFPNISELHLGGGSSSGGGARNGASSSSPVIDPSDVYAASTGGFLGGGSGYV